MASSTAPFFRQLARKSCCKFATVGSAGMQDLEKNRLEAFSDGVIAIIITIMVLELKAPHDASWSALIGLVPVFSSYVLSFIYVAIYWNNHHHMMHTVKRVNGAILWANMHLLFWLSLVPFTTAWMSENHFASTPVLAYGVGLLGPAIAYTLLTMVIIHSQGENSELAAAIGADVKGKASIGLYVLAIAAAPLWPYASVALYAFVAAMWFIPDRRIERARSIQIDQR
jgi:uncharacterized membrane protein